MSAEKALAAMCLELKEEIKREVLRELQTVAAQVELDRKLTIEEAADYLRISEAMLYKLCKEKQIEHATIGIAGSRKPRIIFSAARLETWLKQKESESVISS
jgi:excisionase family DNA binding protein